MHTYYSNLCHGVFDSLADCSYHSVLIAPIALDGDRHRHRPIAFATASLYTRTWLSSINVDSVRDSTSVTANIWRCISIIIAVVITFMATIAIWDVESESNPGKTSTYLSCVLLYRKSSRAACF